jgi:serine/threonine protein kinase
MLRRLGQGGMAEVFEAELVGTHGFSRRVAIKKIAEPLAQEPAIVARFLEEARIASALHHAGIVSVLDFGVMEGVPFQVLELVDGPNADRLLDLYLPRAPSTAIGLPTEVALAIAAGVARALHHAHEALDDRGLPRGIVHRDIKPSNILLSWTGDLKLSDFGIAFAHDRAVQTETGVTPGSWAFMAPEQRSRGPVDRRADVFALGCTLHALCTGESPQRDLDAALALATGEPLRLHPSLDDELRALLAKALSAAPSARFATAASMADALDELLARRVSGDPRRRVHELLASLREAPAPRAGLLDQLLAVELVLTSEHGAVREFELQRTEAAPVAPSPRAAQNLQSESASASASASESASESASASASASPSILLRRLALTPVMAAALALLFWQRPLGDPPRAAAEPSPIALAPPAAPVRSPDTPSAPAPALSPSAPRVEAPVTPAPPPSADPRRDRPRRDRPRSSPPPSAPSPSPPSSSPSSSPAAAPPPSPATSFAAESTGYLKVIPRDRTDPRLVNARIYVDGELRGYSPDPIKATVGTHRIRVVLADDTTELGTYTLEVKADHRDRGHPSTLRVP